MDTLFATVCAVRARSDALAITPSAMGHSWLGVNRATHSLFPERVLEVPHLFSTPAYSQRELMDLCHHICSEGFSQVILSGFPPSFESLAVRFRARGLTVGCVFHGFLAECGLTSRSALPFAAILRLCRAGTIAKLACNKKGLPEAIGRLTGLRAHKIILPTRVANPPVPSHGERASGELHIGVLAHDTFRKNIHNQVTAALLIDGATVHVAGTPALGYWGCPHRLVHHPATIPHGDYVSLLGSMDVNLHLSFSESWGQVTAESLAMGVPCLIADHSDVYDYDPLLREHLVSPHFDDPLALASDVVRVIEERHALAGRCREYVGTLNRMAEHLLREFLEA